jgi:ATP/maltotriose-dependent transcriptional regulator MalT
MADTHHPSADQVAALIEGGLPAAEATRVESHVVRCRACLAAYGDALRIRRELRRGRGRRRGKSDLRDLVLASVPGDGGTNAAPSTRLEASAPRPRRSRVGVWPAAAACLAVAVISAAWWLAVGDRGGARDELWSPVLLAAVQQSSGDGMILPGQARQLLPERPKRRSAGDTQAVDAALAEMATGNRDSASVPLVVALLAAGRLDMARLQIQAARRRGADDPEWLQLAAIVAYRRSDLEEAEALLSRSIEKDPGSEEARFNLGLVRVALGDTTGAREMFAGLLSPDDGSLVVERAKQELASLGPATAR